MTLNQPADAFRFEPNSSIKNTLSRFASDSSRVTLSLVDKHLSFAIEEDGCKVLTTQQVERCIGHSSEPITFGIEARLAKALYPLFPDPINAHFESDCLHIWRGNTSCRWHTTPTTPYASPVLGDQVTEQLVNLAQVKAALTYCLPFAKKTHRQPIESLVHFQGDAVVTGKDFWGAAIVKFHGGPATPSFCLEAKNAVRLRDALNSMTGQVKLSTAEQKQASVAE